MPFSCVRLTAFLLLAGATSSQGATWANDTGSPDANWGTGANWVSASIPGNTNITLTNSDVANFPATSVLEMPVLDSNRRLGSVAIDNSQSGYNILTSAPGNILVLQANGASATSPANGLTITGGGTTTIDPTVRIGGSVSANQRWDTGSTAVTFTNGVSYVGSSNLTLTNTSALSIQGTLSGGGGTLSFYGGGSANISANIQTGVILNSGAGFSGTVSLSGDNSALTNSITHILRTGTLELNGVNSIGASNLQIGTTSSAGQAQILVAAPMTVAGNVRMSADTQNATLVIGASHTSGTTNFNGTLTLYNSTTSTNGLSITSAGTSVVNIAGNIAAAASTTPARINKIGAGVVRFTNATGNTFTGGANVNAGTLLVNNTTGDAIGAVTVNNTGTFGGTGSASGAVTVNLGGRLSPGDSTLAANARAGSLSIGGALAFAANSNVAFELNGTSPGDGAGFYDQVIAGNTVTLSGNVNFTLTLGIDPLDNGTQIFTLLDKTSAGAIAGAGLLNLNGSTLLAQGDTFTVGGQMFQISYSAGTTPATFLSGGNDIAILAIPEPGTAAILTLGLVALGCHRRRG